MDFRRIIAVGDIHGCYRRFMSLWQKMDYEPDADFLIFLGDYIDRGSEPTKVLSFVAGLVGENCVALRGNHEEMFIDYFDADPYIMEYFGGKNQALRYRSFIESLPVSHGLSARGKSYFFCHGGVMPGVPLELQKSNVLLWIREEYYENYTGDTIVVSGHTPTPFIEPGRYTPIIKPNMILLDTGSYLPEGHISAIDVLTGEYWQSDGGIPI